MNFPYNRQDTGITTKWRFPYSHYLTVIIIKGVTWRYRLQELHNLSLTP